jgi:hypothetical protein
VLPDRGVWIACAWHYGNAGAGSDWVCCGWNADSSEHVRWARSEQRVGLGGGLGATTGATSVTVLGSSVSGRTAVDVYGSAPPLSR